MKVVIFLILLCAIFVYFSLQPKREGINDDHPPGICNRNTILDFPRFTHPCCVSNGIEMLGNVTRVFEKYNVPIWLTYGTLLGHLRHKGFIPWDDDIDTLTLAEYTNVIESKIIPEIENVYGHQVKRSQGRSTYSDAPEFDYFTVNFSKTNKLHLDIGLCTGPVSVNTKGSELHILDGPSTAVKTIIGDPTKYRQWIHPVKDTFPLRTVEMYGIKLKIPFDSKTLIKGIYDDTCLTKAKIKKGNIPGMNENLQDIEIYTFTPAIPLK